MSLEELLLTVGMVERRPLTAYRRLLESSVPQAGSCSPGGAEIAKMARVYWKAHLKMGEPLPYFQPLEITELNIFANISGCDFVIYRERGRADRKRRQIEVVADTRLFSNIHDFPGRRCAHVVLDPLGRARKLTDFGLRRRKIKQMLPNRSFKNLVCARTPAKLLAHLKVLMTPVDERDFGELSFLDLRADVRLLDRFTKLLGRPLRLMAANCTSRFKRRGATCTSSVVRTRMTEQRAGKAGVAPTAEPVVVCMQARTSENGDETLVDGLYSEHWNATVCGARKAGKASLVPAVSPKKTLADAKEEAAQAATKEKKTKKNAKPKKERKPRPDRITSHARLDPCCGPDPDDTCSACVQMLAEHAEKKLPPVQSSPHLYAPQKSAGSFLGEARSLGLCDVFPWLENAVLRANLASCSAMDIETLNATLAPGQLSGATSTMCGPDDVTGGSTALTRHVPFVIGTTSFLWKAAQRWTVDGLLWRLQSSATKYVEFRVEERHEVPGQSDVADMVERWLNYVENRRRILAEQKRKVFAPALDALRQMAARSAQFELDNCAKDGRNPQFKYSVYGKLLVKLGRLCEELNVITYNGSKFDLINILSPLVLAAKKMKLKIGIGRKGE